MANSATVGRQGTLVDNTTNLYIGALVSVSIKMGTSPSNNSPVYVLLIRSDNGATTIESDGAGATDAAWTWNNASILGILKTSGSAATGDVLSGVFDTRFLGSLGPKWTIGIVNNSGVALDSTEGNHTKQFIGITNTVV